MKKYNWYLQIARIIIIVLVFAGIAFDDTPGRLFFMLAFFCSIINDFFRKRFFKKRILYIISLLLSMLIAGTIKYFIFSLLDGYLYILLIEIMFRDKIKLPVYLLLLHFLAFFASDFLTILLHGNNHGLLSLFGNDLFYYFLGLCIILSVREILIQKDQMQALNNELNNKNRQLEQYQNRLKELALSTERNRVAQELHDSLGHTLIAIRMHIKVMQKLTHNSTDKENQIIQSLDEIALDGIHQLRETVFKLKNDSGLTQLKSSLQEMIDHLSVNGETKIIFEFDDNVDKCLPEIKDVIYKTVKECLTNSIRHGKANEIKITILEANDDVHLKIIDNGLGCGTVKKSFGLQGIDERISVLGGITSYITEVNKGFIFKADFPIYKRKSNK